MDCMEQPDVIWENQRFYGIGWQSPGLLERTSISDAEGYPVNIDHRPSEIEHGGWDVDTSPATDEEGWQYASIFRHFDNARAGGRASQRVTDLVRRRCWHRTKDHANGMCIPLQLMGAGSRAGVAASFSENVSGDEGTEHRQIDMGHVGPDAAADVDPMMGQRAQAAAQPAGRSTQSLSSKLAQHRRRQEAEADKRRAVLRIFIGMFTSSIKRWQLWNLMPLDPMSWLVLYNEHHSALADLITSNMPHRLPVDSLQEGVGSRPQEAPSSAGTGSSAPVQDAEPKERPEQGRVLVQDLLRAAIHSRAAYGYAMQAGHVASVMSFALMHTVHSLSFDAAGGASAEANSQAVSILAGIDVDDILQAEWLNGVGRPCHYVAVDRANHSIVLAVRGSLEVGDIFSDISATALEVTLLQCDGQVHEGIMAAATYVHSNTASALQQAAVEFPGWPVLVTGHSLGGAVASLVAVLLQEHGAPAGLGPVHAIGIGPASVMSHRLAARCDGLVTSVCLRSDFVPRLTYASIEGIFLELADASPVRKAAQGVSRRVAATLEGLGVWAPKPCITPAPKSLPGLADLPSLAEGGSGAADKAARTANSALASSSARSPSFNPRVNPILGPASKPTKLPTSSPSSAMGRLPPVEVAARYASPVRGVGGVLRVDEARNSGRELPKPGWARLQTRGSTELANGTTDGGNDRCFGSVSNNSRSGASKGDAAMPRKESADDELSAAAAGGVSRAQHANPEEQAVLADVFSDVPAVGKGGEKPEALYPAGRVLWIIPADETALEYEEVKDADEDEEDEEAGFFQNGGKLPIPRNGRADQSHSAVSSPGQTQSATTNGQGTEALFKSLEAVIPARDPITNASPAKQPEGGKKPRPVPGRAVRQRQSRDDVPAGDSPTGLERGRIIGFGGSGRGGFGPGYGDYNPAAESPSTGGTQDSGGDFEKPKPKPPALLDVDRRVFSRILMSPDCMSDHLPDTYLMYLQQL